MFGGKGWPRRDDEDPETQTLAANHRLSSLSESGPRKSALYLHLSTSPI